MTRATIITKLTDGGGKRAFRFGEIVFALGAYYKGFDPEEKEAILDDARESLAIAEYRKAVDLLTINCHTPAGQAFGLNGWTFVRDDTISAFVEELKYYGGFASGGK